MEQIDPEMQEDLGMGGKFKNWIQDNIRIIISVLIVIAIAGGIYSYSKRGEEITIDENLIVEDIEKDDEAAVTVVGEENSDNKEDSSKEEAENKEDVTTKNETKDETQEIVENKEKEEVPKAEEVTKVEEVKKVEEAEKVEAVEKVEEKKPEQEDVKIDTQIAERVSEETGDAFIEKAINGDSLTTLARKALKDYLEKNQDSSLTAEHKIYIEDYLRKNIDHQGGLSVGDSVSFSKILIKDGIEKAKTLSESQLKNLEKYSARVSNL